MLCCFSFTECPRYLPQVRSSVLDALVLLLDKGGRMLKAFVPQMQTSLVKNLKDPYAPVRATALKALKRLLRLSTRIDPLVSFWHRLLRTVQRSRGGADVHPFPGVV